MVAQGLGTGCAGCLSQDMVCGHWLTSVLFPGSFNDLDHKNNLESWRQLIGVACDLAK